MVLQDSTLYRHSISIVLMVDGAVSPLMLCFRPKKLTGSISNVNYRLECCPHAHFRFAANRRTCGTTVLGSLNRSFFLLWRHIRCLVTFIIPESNIIGERERANLVVRLARFFYMYVVYVCMCRVRCPLP